jgi:hypothetical protein
MGNKSTYTKMPENTEKISLEKNSHTRIIDEKIIPNLINDGTFKIDLELTIPFTPRPQCNTMFIVNPE